MKFQGTPGMVVTDAKTHKVIGQFNKNGYMDVEDPRLIERFRLKFKPATVVCTKCGEAFETKGAFLTHNRKEHGNDSK